MNYLRRRVLGLRPSGSGLARPKAADERKANRESGFTLVELLIVITVLPLVVGAISVGLISVFSLQSGVSSRLSHTADAQVVSANFAKDVQGASAITTSSSSSPQCGTGTGTQLVGLEYNLDTNQSDPTVGQYQYNVSYRSVPVTSNGTTTYSLERFYCDNYSQNLVSTSVLAYDLSSGQSVPALTCVQNPVPLNACSNAASIWTSTQNVSQVSMLVSDPKNNFRYSLVASPLAASSTSTAGSPVSNSTAAGCGFASPGSGTYAQNLCFIDFTSLNGPALLQAQGGGCLEMSVALPNNYTLYFCISLSGGLVLPWYMPTWTNAFLGNSINGIPFYTGVPGFPALYERQQGTTAVVKLSNITVVSPWGVPATGWQFVTTDAESTDTGESISVNSDVILHVIPNAEAGQLQPVGN